MPEEPWRVKWKHSHDEQGTGKEVHVTGSESLRVKTILMVLDFFIAELSIRKTYIQHLTNAF
jgi:hypothetical protein